MGFPTQVQLIQRKDSQQWYINFPSAIAQAMEFTRGEIVEWVVENQGQLLLRRRKVPATTLKKTKRGKV
jgi:antitoxin component of MazEF toxin-antitoxin module